MRVSRPDPPQDLERAADRNRAARHSSRPLLDPHGIYGTRTAARQRAARKRQSFQSLLILSLIAVVVIAALWGLSQRRVPYLAQLEKTDLGVRMAAAAARGRVGRQDVHVVPGQDGSLRFRWGTTASTWHNDFALRAAPLVALNKVFAASENGAVHALTAAPGKPAKVSWKWFAASPVSTGMALYAPGAALAQPGSAPPAAAPQPLLIVADDEGVVTALKTAGGSPAWAQRLRAPAGDALTVESNGSLAGRVWVPLGAGAGGFDGGVACLEAHTGRVLWKVPLNAPVLQAPALDSAAERLYCASDDGEVFALNARTGRTIWRVAAKPPDGSPSGVVLRGAVTLFAAGSRLVVGGNDGVLRALDASNGAPLWQWETGAAVRFAAVPFQAGQRELLACAGDGGTVWVLDAASGLPVNRLAISGTPVGAPVVSDAIEVVSSTGWLQRFAVPG